jgi:hypothetical protein
VIKKNLVWNEGMGPARKGGGRSEKKNRSGKAKAHVTSPNEQYETKLQ